ncbi:MAG: MFS transporter [Propionibacteriales bacterium]|nr:MFS transporter [Propionibacteriales bacterium]
MTTATSDRGAGMLPTLMQRDFALLWVGGLVSTLGSWATFVAIPIFVYQETRSALATTMVFTITVVPMLLGSVAGVFVDRWDRKRTLVVANVVLAALTVPLLRAQSGHLWLIYVSMANLALAGLVIAPAENALLPRLVGPDRLVAANSLNSLNDNLGRIIGPAVGSGLFALGGFTTVVIFDVCTFVVAAGLIWLIRTSGTPPVVSAENPGIDEARSKGDADATASTRPDVPDRRWRSEWLAGLASVKESTAVPVVFAAAATALLGDAILSSLLAPFVAETLSSGATVLGLFLTIRGVGGVIGGLASSFLSRWLKPERMIGWNTLALGILLAMIVAVPLVPVALVGAAFLGIFVVGWITNQQTLIQTNVADQYLGRVYGVLGTITALSLIIGSLLAGLLAERVGVPPLLFGAAGCYAAAGLIALFGLRADQPRAAN